MNFIGFPRVTATQIPMKRINTNMNRNSVRAQVGFFPEHQQPLLYISQLLIINEFPLGSWNKVWGGVFFIFPSNHLNRFELLLLLHGHAENLINNPICNRHPAFLRRKLVHWISISKHFLYRQHYISSAFNDLFIILSFYIYVTQWKEMTSVISAI